ncbi:MAG: type II secretion system major pseudopilin GspG [Acidobacteria bacterium]|nr:type II secretion system major pseudopilin GspG [Acidobacteriota bacterium]
MSRAFTLIEMMAVVVIIGIVAAMLAVNVIGRVPVAKQKVALQDLRTLEQAIALYRMDTGSIPPELADLVNAPQEKGDWNGPYLPRMPVDPWGSPYRYDRSIGAGRDYQVWTYGADRKEGGVEDDADLFL